MSHYWKKCPHCGKAVEEGRVLYKDLGDPIRICKWCFKKYKDRSIIDWPTATWWQKFLYCLANGRFFLCLMPYLIVSALVANNFLGWKDGLTYLVCLPVFILCFALCIVYVKIQVKLNYGGTKKPQKSKDNDAKHKGIFK